MGSNEKNLWQRNFKNRRKAQIATFLTLFIALTLLFVAVTINIGRIAQNRTELSINADRAAASLASNLGSYSHYLSEKYLDGGTKQCGGFSWGMFFQTLFTAGMLGPLGIPYIVMVATTESGPVVDMIMKIAGYVALVVMIIILIILIIILCILSGFYLSFELVVALMPIFEAIMAAAVAIGVSATALVVAMIALVATTVISQGYNAVKYGGESVSFFSNSSGVATVIWMRMNKAFADMGTKLQFRERTRLDALASAARNDTRLVDDIYDDDWDRLTNDKIPAFYQTYSYWLRQLNAESTKTNDQLDNLLMNTLCGCDTCSPAGGFAQTVKVDTERLRTTGESTFANVESCSVFVPRVDISFWKPQSVIDNCTRTCPPGCDMECSDAEGNCALFEACTACHERCYDEFHKMLYDLGSGPAPYDDGFYEWAQQLCQAYKSDPKSVEKSIDEWYPQLFDSEPDSEAPDYYTILSYWQGRIKSVWVQELWKVVDKVNAYNSNCSLVYNCSCPLKTMLVQTINTLTDLANEIGEFNSAVLQFNNSVGKADKKTNCGSCGSDGEFCYSWYDYLGSSGKQTPSYHHIRVKVASFSLPKLKAYRSDFKKCLKLEHHDGTAKVTIKQFDQDSSPVGPFGWIFRYNKSQTKPTTPNVLCSIPEEYWISTTGAVNWNHKGKPPKFSDESK